ncbi:MAG: hypothetical protein WCE68_19010 [Anaerolineales bacterium]
MITPSNRLQFYRVITAFMLLIFVGSSCTFSPSTPVIRTVQVTQVVTQLVTLDVTQEETRIVEVPITVTPSVTPLYTFTPSLTPTITNTPTITPTQEPPVVTVLEHSDCFYGPGSGYLYKYSVMAASSMEVVGRNLDGSWLYIQSVGGWNPCWIQTALVKFNAADSENIPIVYSTLPYANEYSSPDATVQRNGDEVTISWKAVWISFDDYRGYLIEAWVCQGGTQVFIPLSYVPLVANNTGILSVKVTDGPGCNVPSSARIYSVEKHGYSAPSNIPWPPFQVTPTPGSD